MKMLTTNNKYKTRYRKLKSLYENIDFNNKGLLHFTIITMIAVSIFIPFRWVEGDYYLLISSISTVVISGLVHVLLLNGKAIIARRTFASYMFCILIFMIYHSGASELSLIYPGGAMLFFSLKPSSALKVCSVLIVIVGALVWHELVFSRWLQDMVSLICSSLVVYTFCIKVDQHIADLNSKTMLDKLSGLDNRRSFEHDIKRLPLLKNKTHYLLILDIDDFKLINDQYGHDIGDKVIKQVSQHIKDKLRSSEKIYRIGGEEFAIVVPAEKTENVAKFAERIRKLVELSKFITLDGEHINYTVSVGVSAYQKNKVEWFRLADQALYKAKNSGKNTVRFAM